MNQLSTSPKTLFFSQLPSSLSSLDKLPKDVLNYTILNFLLKKDLANLSALNHRFNEKIVGEERVKQVNRLNKLINAFVKSKQSSSGPPNPLITKKAEEFRFECASKMSPKLTLGLKSIECQFSLTFQWLGNQLHNYDKGLTLFRLRTYSEFSYVLKDAEIIYRITDPFHRIYDIKAIIEKYGSEYLSIIISSIKNYNINVFKITEDNRAPLIVKEDDFKNSIKRLLEEGEKKLLETVTFVNELIKQAPSPDGTSCDLHCLIIEHCSGDFRRILQVLKAISIDFRKSAKLYLCDLIKRPLKENNIKEIFAILKSLYETFSAKDIAFMEEAFCLAVQGNREYFLKLMNIPLEENLKLKIINFVDPSHLILGFQLSQKQINDLYNVHVAKKEFLVAFKLIEKFYDKKRIDYFPYLDNLIKSCMQNNEYDHANRIANAIPNAEKRKKVIDQIAKQQTPTRSFKTFFKRFFS